MPKILHIITRMDRGGSAQNTLLTCIGLKDRYEVVLAQGPSLESKMTQWEKESVYRGLEEAREGGVKVKTIPSLLQRINPLRDIRACFAILSLIIQEKPDILHTHTSKAGILGRWAAVIARVPKVVHTPHGHVFYGHFGTLVSKIFLLIERLAGRITDSVIALTPSEMHDYIALAVYRPEQLLTVHSGVDVQRFKQTRLNVQDKKKSLGLSPQRLLVGSVGWLLPVKGPRYLLEAMCRIWEEYPDVELVYVGKGELEEQLKQDVMRLGLANKVTFLGWRDDIPKIMQLLDIFVLPSLNEGMGRVLVEAMSAGKPVVASRTGGIPDLVQHGKNGFLVEPGDVKGLSLAVKKLLLDGQLRRDMGQVGMAMAQEYSVERMLEKIDALYSSLISHRTHGDTEFSFSARREKRAQALG